jgi:hypothetical protein
MKDLTSFLPLVRQFAPGVAEPTAIVHLRQAAIQFCERTRLWRWDEAIDVSGDDPDLVAPDGSAIHKIEAVRFNEQTVDPATTDYLDRVIPNWRTMVSTVSRPTWYTQSAPNTLRLVPRAIGTVNLYAYLKPSQDATQVPDWMDEQYREAIAGGALSRILVIPNQSFSNGELAGAFGAAWAAKLDELSTAGTQGQQRAPMRTRARFF